jgi:Bax protein
MTVQQPSWAKLLLALTLLCYLLGLLVFVALAPLTQLGPPPAEAEPDAAPELVLVLDPPDFREITDVTERKQAFFDFLQPLIAHQNDFYQREREHLKAIAAKLEAGESLSDSDYDKLDLWAEKLRVEETLTEEEQVEVLLRRLHIIPESMVLAQAAAESAWGQSRFAREANNFFGQWCYRPGCGLIPLERDAAAKHEVRKFDSALEAVEAYFLNINTHRAYRALRDRRLLLEQQGEPITGRELIDELGHYSQRGQRYIDELRQIIHGNELE